MTAVKHKVKYSVDYDSSTDTLSEKLNILLNDIITLIRTNNPEILELSRITYGSDEMTGAPLYDNQHTNNFNVWVQNGGRYQSDLVFLGLSKNNLVLSIGFIDNKLVLAMNIDPSIESIYVNNWNSIKPNDYLLPMFAVGMASRYSKRGDTENQNEYNLFFPFIISNKKIEITVVYWTGNNSSGYMFYNIQRLTNEVDLVFYKSSVNGNNSLCCALYRFSKDYNNYMAVQPQLLTFSFDENVSDNLVLDKTLPYGQIDNNGTRDAETIVIAQPNSNLDANSKYNLRYWFAQPYYYRSNYDNRYTAFGKNCCLFMSKLHTLGKLDGRMVSNNSVSMPNYDNVKTFRHKNVNADQLVSPMCSAYSLPYLENENEVYLRQVRVPGFIDSCYGELYMMWTPSIQSYKSGDIVEIDDDKYAVINEGVVCWVTKV